MVVPTVCSFLPNGTVKQINISLFCSLQRCNIYYTIYSVAAINDYILYIGLIHLNLNI